MYVGVSQGEEKIPLTVDLADPGHPGDVDIDQKADP